MFAVTWHKATITITNEEGLHARPATEFVETANRFKSKIEVVTPDRTVDAKSIFHMLGLGAGKGFQINLQAKGPDAAKAVKELTDLLIATVSNPEYEARLAVQTRESAEKNSQDGS